MAKKNDGPHSYNPKALRALNQFWTCYGQVIEGYGRIPVSADDTGVGGSTYRAYGSYVNADAKKKKGKQIGWTPSRIFKGWLKAKFLDFDFGDAESFENVHKLARKSLTKYWRHKARNAKTPLPCIPYATKLIDLHLKHLLWHPIVIDQGRREKITSDIYQPLDQYSLICLNQFGVILIAGKKNRKNPTMGLIKTEEQYLYLQKEIKCICKTAKVPSFAFDQFAWNYGDKEDRT